jgi:anti-sigma factor RsiW
MKNSIHDMKKCLSLFEKLSDYIDNELDELTYKDIERHIQDCIGCKTCLATLKQTIALCKHAEKKPVPEEFSMRLKEVIEDSLQQATGNALTIAAKNLSG